MRNLVKLVVSVFAITFVSSTAHSANMSIDMLNKLGKERMVYSVDVAKIDVGDTITWLPHLEDIMYTLSLVQMDGSYQRKASIIKRLLSLLTHRACIFTSAHHMLEWV